MAVGTATFKPSLFHWGRAPVTLPVPQTDIAIPANSREVGNCEVAAGVPSSTPDSATAASGGCRDKKLGR